MMRVACLALLLSACFEKHDAGVTPLRQGECYTCHVSEYEATTAPVHAGSYPTTCVDCHRTSGWQPALDGRHPDERFPRTNGHATGCLECHDLDLGASSVGGANTNCIRCHPNTATLARDHDGALGVDSQPYRYREDVPNFCLSCHPSGTALHHDDFFPRNHGDAKGVCTNCHIRELGPDNQNVTCKNAGCHTQPGIDRDHDGERDYDPNRCLVCHPGGRKD